MNIRCEHHQAEREEVPVWMRPEKVSYHSEPCLSWASAEHKDLESVEDLVKDMVTVAKNKEVRSLPVGLTKRKVEKLHSRDHSEVYPGSRSCFRM